MKKLSTLAQYEYRFSLQILNYRRIGLEEEETEDLAPQKKTPTNLKVRSYWREGKAVFTQDET